MFVKDRLQLVFQEVFEDDGLVITPQMTAKDVENWDSLMHVSLMINVEKAFNIRFRTIEIAGIKNVGELIQLIDTRLSLKQKGPSERAPITAN